MGLAEHECEGDDEQLITDVIVDGSGFLSNIDRLL